MGATIPALKFSGRHTFVHHVATSGCRFGSRGLRAPGTGDGGGTSEQVERCPTEGSPNMRTSMAYFAGAGTVIAAIVGGVGGGLLIAEMVSPKSPKQGVEQTRLERRTSPAPIAAASAPSEPVQYLSASQLPPSGAAAEPVPAPAQTQADNSASKPPQPVDTAAQAPQPAAAAAQPVAREQTAAADDAVARTRDGDSRRAVEKRRTERHQHWADRRRHQPRQEQELQAVDERGREEIEPRREFAPEPERATRVIRLFGLE
jgi:type IV secretory pathway VirB10-like protein